MDLNEIFVFTRVVQAGSFRAAARELDMPKSTVSRKVSELGERLGARLLQRTTRKLHLTDVGAAYFQHSTRIMAEVEEAEIAVTNMQATPRGVLRVSAPLNFSFLGPITTEYLRRYAETQIEMVCTDRVVNLVEEGFDVAIRAGQQADSTLISRSLGKGRALVVASPDYVKRCGTPSSPEDLKAYDCVVFGAGTRNHWKLESEGKTADVTVSARIIVNDFGVLQEATLSGLGIAMLPAYICVEHFRTQRLKQLLKGWCSPEMPIQAVYPSTRHLSPKVKAFLDLLRERLTPPPWELGPAP